jgi:hypothetical protein
MSTDIPDIKCSCPCPLLRSRIANGYKCGHPKFYVTHNGNGYGHPDFFIRRTRTRSRFRVCGHGQGHAHLSVSSPTDCECCSVGTQGCGGHVTFLRRCQEALLDRHPHRTCGREDYVGGRDRFSQINLRRSRAGWRDWFSLLLIREQFQYYFSV